eukprot:g74120.t1
MQVLRGPLTRSKKSYDLHRLPALEERTASTLNDMGEALSQEQDDCRRNSQNLRLWTQKARRRRTGWIAPQAWWWDRCWCPHKMLFAVAGIRLCHEHYSISAKRSRSSFELGAAQISRWQPQTLAGVPAVRKKKQATVIEMYLVKHHPSLRGSRAERSVRVLDGVAGVLHFISLN